MSDMFIDAIQARYPDRVLSSLHLEYMGFTANFDLPEREHLRLTMHAYVKDNARELEIYEIAVISNRAQHRAHPHSASSIIKGSDPIPVLRRWLQIALGGSECGYEGSFAESVLANGMQRQEVTP